MNKNAITTDQLFEEAYQALNPNQQLAVDSIDGPVLVMAGPGTGKTQILAARVARILTETDTLPEQILCLTYTDAGTIAMRKRLNQFIGPDAYRVPIFTFHAFCNKVIQENLDHFGLKALDAISELERKSFVREIIDAFPKNHPLKRYSGEVYYEVDKLLNLYDLMKREDWTEQWLCKRINQYIKDLATREEHIYKRDSKHGKKGELKKSYHEEVKRMNQLEAAVGTFASYQAMLKQHHRYDFADMILWVIEAFKTNAAMLSNYQEQYLYFLVDEYQDTSGSQNHVLQLLIDYWESPNVFCVGDDDQSIFRFQGANVQNIQEFVTRYHPKKISLVQNYRSSQYVLDLAKVCIDYNETRIDNDKQLIASNPGVAQSNVQPRLQAYHNPMQEAVAIATEIEGLLNQGVTGNEIAVLYRKHDQAAWMMTYLRSKNIPITVRKRVNILEEPIIKKLIQLMRYLSAENKKAHSGEPFIYEILHYDFFQIDPLRIAKISIETYRKNFKERTTSWREALRNSQAVNAADLFTVSDHTESIAKASVLLERWITSSFNCTIQELMQQVISESGLLVQALTSSEKNWNMQLLHTFFDFIKDECSRHPKTTLKSLLETLLLMEEERVSLSAQHVLYAENGVNFMSVHGSKGLEFDHVYVIGCNSKKWESAREGSKNYKLPDNLFDIQSTDDTEENRRLFYVAMTRAKTHLTLSYAIQDEDGKELEKSQYVAEIENFAHLTKESSVVDDATMVSFEMNVLLKQPSTTKVNLFDNELVDELLKEYSLSVTHLNNYLKCATAFYFDNLIRVPAPLSSAMTFGSAVHHALEQLFKNMNNHPNKEFSGSKTLVDDFKWFMRRNEEAFTDADFKRRIEYGEMILPKFYDHYIHEWNKVTSVERSYRNVVMEGVPLNGKLDKLEFDGNFVNVVDYKTGKYDNAIKKFKTPQLEKIEELKAQGKEVKFEEEFGGDYWRQAVFYKILMDYDKTKNWEMRTAEFDFVEPDKDSGEFKKQRVAITSVDVDTVKQQIHYAYKGIKQKQFDKGCGKEDCNWCEFVKSYYRS